MLPPVPAAIAPTVPSLDDPRVLKRIMRSLRDGLPPTHTNMRQFAVGIRDLTCSIERFLHKVRSEGGAALDIRGQYGEGKTFTLSLTEQNGP